MTLFKFNCPEDFNWSYSTFSKLDNRPSNNKLEDKDIIDLLEKRNNFRIEKKYDQADKIRDQLLDLGIEILDSKDGSTYRKI